MTPEQSFKLWQEHGDDFSIFRNEKGGGVVMVKTDEAMEALKLGIDKLRERKTEMGVYKR